MSDNVCVLSLLIAGIADNGVMLEAETFWVPPTRGRCLCFIAINGVIDTRYDLSDVLHQPAQASGVNDVDE
eukprot:15160548-Heterocapsa_arctica.AAC.1